MAQPVASTAAISNKGIWVNVQSSTQWGPQPNWISAVFRRVGELLGHDENWDSYGGKGLQHAAIIGLVTTLAEFNYWVQSPPRVSLRADGGLVCAWSTSDYTLELDALPDGRLTASFVDSVGQEWEEPLRKLWGSRGKVAMVFERAPDLRCVTNAAGLSMTR